MSDPEWEKKLQEHRDVLKRVFPKMPISEFVTRYLVGNEPVEEEELNGTEEPTDRPEPTGGSGEEDETDT